MRLKLLSAADKKAFEKYLNLKKHSLSAYSFENVFIWKKLYRIQWGIFEDNLCVFFKDKIGSFLYLPPLGKDKNPAAYNKAFKIMNSYNHNRDISRIENIEEEDLLYYQKAGYYCVQKPPEYLCLQSALSALRGDKFKSKRACCNYFIKNYQYKCIPFSLKDKKNCFKLYNSWMNERSSKNSDSIYSGMLKDSLACLKVALENYPRLGFRGVAVKIDGGLKAFTFGYELNKEIFCILYEIADLSVKGLAQFIFRSFCADLTGYKYINIMDDSGLENLKTVKLSYQPVKLVPAYIAGRKNG